MNPRGRVLNSCRWPGQRWLAEAGLFGASPNPGSPPIIRSHMPKDVLALKAKVWSGDALAFIAPIHFCTFPSILKGWIDRVWILDFAYGLTSAGWHGDVNRRIPLLHTSGCSP
jgi:NAD(P)H dehydrogenase (quinone)